MQLPKPTASAVLSKLADITNRSRDESVREPPRSWAFTEKPAFPLELSKTDRDKDLGKDLPVRTRDDRLALIEDLEPGPYDHKAPFDDPHFERLEPNSGIRLK